jgi:hypothetical protein
VRQLPVSKDVNTEAEEATATNSEDTADWEDVMRAVVNCRVCELAIVL